MHYDAIGMEIFANRLLAITKMGVALVRSSFSPNIKERRDCSVALFTANGKVIAQAAHIPIHLGSLAAVEGCFEIILGDVETGRCLRVTMLIWQVVASS